MTKKLPTKNDIPNHIQEKLGDAYTALPVQIIKQKPTWISFVFFVFGISVGMVLTMFLGYYLFLEDDSVGKLNAEKIRYLEDDLQKERERLNSEVEERKNVTEKHEEYLCETRWDYGCK